jgi:insulysin
MVKILMKFKSLFVLILLVTACSDNKYFASGSGTAIGEKVSVTGADVSSLALKNGLRAIVISSPDRKDSAISVAVDVGSYSDPSNHVGLAHFVEHLLFLGTKEYPESDGLLTYVSANGGAANADTASSRTRYFFSVKPELLEDCTHRLSRFFVSPLFPEVFTDKEKNAINNEFLMRFDGMAQSRAGAVFYKTGASIRRFNVGNIETLANTKAADAREFFEKFYSADKMVVVITGPQSLETLSAMVKKYFADVPIRSGVSEKQDPVQIDPKQMNQVIKIANPKFDSSLRFSIVLDDEFKEIPDSFSTTMNRLLAGEGKGSLLSVLQDKGWAVPKAGSISAYIYGGQLQYAIDLTPDGVEHYQEIILLAKSQMEFFRTHKYPDYVQLEAQGLTKAYSLDRDYSTLKLDEVANLSASLLNTKNWKGLFTVDEFKPFAESLYTQFFAKLNFDKVIVTLIDGGASSSLSYDTLAKTATLADPDRLDVVEQGGKKYLLDGYIKAAYELVPLALSGLPAVNSADFSLPMKNDYIPQDFTMYPKDPLASVATANAEVFLNPGAYVNQPKAYFRGMFFSPDVKRSDKSQFVKLVVMKNWLMSEIKQNSYPLVEADFKIEMTTNRAYKAVELSCSGWSGGFEKAITDAIGLLDFSENEIAFERFKKIMIVSLQQQVNDPESRLGTELVGAYIEGTPTLSEHVAIVESLTLADIRDTYHQLFDHFYFQGVVSGNVKTSFAEAASSAIQNKFNPKPVTAAELAALKLPDYSTVDSQTVIEIDVNDSQNAYVANFFNFGSSSKKEQIITQIIGNWISGDFFNELRTQQQIAYSLSADFGGEGQYYGLLMYVQSGTNASEDVSARMEAFLHKWVSETLVLKTQDDVNAFVKRTQDAEEAAKKAEISSYRALGKFLGLEPVYSDESDMAEVYRITIEEVISMARKRLIENPSGVFIKVRSDKDKKHQIVPLLGPA